MNCKYYMNLPVHLQREPSDALVCKFRYLKRYVMDQQNTISTIFITRRYFTKSSSAAAAGRGALPGGFSKENLVAWSKRQWGESQIPGEDHYVDLFSHKISSPCAEMLGKHSHPSSAVGHALFSHHSNHFKAKHTLLTLISPNSPKEVPQMFQRGDAFLLWTVRDVTPHELICEWELGKRVLGFTMLALDPRLRKIYLGSGLEATELQKGSLFRSYLLPMHVAYSKFLLKGMAEHLEQQVPI